MEGGGEKKEGKGGKRKRRGRGRGKVERKDQGGGKRAGRWEKGREDICTSCTYILVQVHKSSKFQLSKQSKWCEVVGIDSFEPKHLNFRNYFAKQAL